MCEIEDQGPPGVPTSKELELAEDREFLGQVEACAPWTMPAQPVLGEFAYSMVDCDVGDSVDLITRLDMKQQW